MDFLDFKAIESKVKIYAHKISAAEDDFPTYGYSRDFGSSHIEVDHNGYHYVSVERGQELERKITQDVHELLFWIFDPITFSMAANFELHNRIATQDSRRIIFDKQEELIGILDTDWKKRVHDYHSKILEKYPFDDTTGGHKAVPC